jgi:Zn finger protein HypA/HybF involved in hydrogenase expression
VRIWSLPDRPWGESYTPAMDLEEHVGVEEVKERCESCGAKLTDAEIKAALDGASDVFLCARCASEQVEVEEGAEEL